MSKLPTDGARSYATQTTDDIADLMRQVVAKTKLLLAEKVFQNGIRGNATGIRDKINEAEDLVPKLRKAILDDLGAEPEKPKLTNEMRGPEKLAEDAQDILAEMAERTEP